MNLKADFSASADFKFGYDTHGLDLYAESGNLADVFAGFFADESESKVRVDGEFTIGIGAGWVGLNIGGRGGLFAEATADLRDPDGDGKVRVNELLENLEHGLACAFDISGSVDLGFRIHGSIGYWPLEVSFDYRPFPDVTLYEFDVDHDDCFPDRFEGTHATSNDTRAQAVDIGIAPGVHLADVGISSENDSDWYRFEVLRPIDVMDVRLDYVEALGNLDLEVTNAAGNNLGRSLSLGHSLDLGLTASNSSADRVTLHDVAPGVYYVHVFGHGAENAYKLFIDPGQQSAVRVLYVNDGSVNDNQFYTLGPGDDTNDGLSYLTPKATLASLIADQQIGPNDIVLFDTGVYASGTAVLTAADGGQFSPARPRAARWHTAGPALNSTIPATILFSDLIFAGAGGTGIHIRGDGADDAHGNVIEHNQFLGTDTGVRSDSQGSNSIR